MAWKNLKKSKIIIYLIGSIVILANLILSSYHLFTGELLFHTDIARDFLLMENMLTNSKIDLIGPRAGGIPGMFFGPIWYWITLPIFIIGKGNPVFIAIFWYLLVILLLAIVYFVTKKIFGKETGFISLILISFYSFNLAHGFTQSFGSLILSPIIFFLIYRFYITKKVRYFLLCLLTIGFTFHLQPAFSMLILLTTFILSIPFLVKAKKIHYLLSYLILIIPFSTYIIFEFRHNFLEIRAFTNFLLNSPIDRQKIDFLAILANRTEGFLSRLNLFGTGTSTLWEPILFLFIYIFILIKGLKKSLKGKEFYIIFYSYYLFFWVLSFFFRGLIWDFYHWGFLPLTVIIFSSLFNLVNKKLFFVIFSSICLHLFILNLYSLNSWANDFSSKNNSSWILNYRIAQNIFKDSKGDFGYFVYSPDDFGYSMRYAMNYTQKEISNKKGNFCQKKPTTYLIYYPDVAHNSSTYWKNKKVNITSKPKETEKFGDIIVEKYSLNERDMVINQDPNLLCSLIFR